jgi:serine/threonine-protein kinase
MGEVWRATDTNLGRQVALKVLPDTFADDPERLARFEREAKTLAALSHPNIAGIYGFEKADGIQALAMEFVDGPTLADRIAQGPIPVDEALPVARQIAEALEAAHDQGIVHRDLKPANIKVRDDGTAKVLDFGLAKMIDDGPPRGGQYADGSVPPQSNLTMSPTITTPAMTQLGVILGTAAYMAPEQAKGKPADKRSDIWSFGCVLYEMLTGKKAFGGEDVGDTLAAVIRGEPDWTALPRDLPSSIRVLLMRCLEKDRRARVPDISVARFVMADTSAALSDIPAASTVARRRSWIGVALGALAGAALTFLIGWGALRMRPALPAEPARFTIDLPPGQSLENATGPDIVISPDGRYVVYVATVGGRTQLALRAFGELDARLIAGTEGGLSPFVSHDGRWIGFFTNIGGGDGELKKVAIAGGPPVPLCRFRGNAAGASWGSDDSIVFATTDLTSGLFRVPSAGGEPKVLSTPDRSRGEIDHRYPVALPGGNTVLFSLATADSYDVAALNLVTGERHSIISGGHDAQYVNSGHLVYAVEQTLRAVSFDPDSLTVKGDPVPVLQDVRVGQAVLSAADFSVSRDGGALVYVPGSIARQDAMRSLLWVTREGREDTINAPKRGYVIARISPDGHKVALDVREQQADIWIWDFERENFTRLTSDQSNERNPLWMPNGERIVYASNRSSGSLSLYWQRADGIGQAELLATATGFIVPTGVSPDGTRIALMENLDITMVTLDPPATRDSGSSGDSSASPKAGGPRRSEPLLATAFTEDNGEISPDGRWLAYQSNESGQNQIYVRSFPNIDQFRVQVTTAGGRTPAWSRNGHELFYLDASNRLTSVPVQMGATFSAGKPAQVLSTPYFAGFGNRPYDISPDGRRFLMIKESAPETAITTPPPGFAVVLNWREELKRRVPVN